MSTATDRRATLGVNRPVDRVFDLVSRLYCIKYEDLRSPTIQTKTATVSRARSVVVWILRTRFAFSLPEIAQIVGYADSSSVGEACQRVETRPDLMEEAQRIAKYLSDRFSLEHVDTIEERVTKLEEHMSEARRSGLCPEGRHIARPIKWGFVKTELRENGGGGVTQYAVECETKSGQVITWFGSLNLNPPAGGDTAAKDITERALRAWGWVGNDWRSVVLTKPARIVVQHEEWNGRERAKIVSVDESIVERLAASPSEIDQIADVLNKSMDK